MARARTALAPWALLPVLLRGLLRRLNRDDRDLDIFHRYASRFGAPVSGGSSIFAPLEDDEGRLWMGSTPACWMPRRPGLQHPPGNNSRHPRKYPRHGG